MTKFLYRWLPVLPIIAALVFFVLPVLWMVLTSFKSAADVGATDPKWIFEPVLDNYRRIFRDQPLIEMIRNSLTISIGSTILSTGLGAAAAYGLTRARLLGRQPVMLWFLFQRAVPPVVVFVPLYIYFHKLGLVNTHLGLILAYTLFELPFAVLTMVSFFNDLPEEVGEAAELDGCSRLQRFVLVDLPMALPGLAITAFFCLLLSWNEFILAKIIAGPDTTTLPLAVNTYLFAAGTVGTVPWGPLSAIGVIIILPVFAATLLLQKSLVRGMTSGALK